ncbi:hypothetical protein B0T11DRAFT_20472 [Plectosphaerella cucumerina]|uniref:J domain-containing protein n=1 Tax=Plectosphaerella cucumerina TaxID=40658 RepID=A0A8K0TVW5_9PEZI|nr:hypothetical protein B0T11DRAFT_20472 [Plectosphaerella cucumerina]
MSGFLSLMGWSFLPNLATGWIQTIYYSITIRAGDPRPQPGSHRFAAHRRKILVLVITAYLAYTLFEAHHDLTRQGTFYSDLGLSSLSADDREIKSRFRRLGALNHPDKARADAQHGAADRFIALKLASETLLDPARRFAYDRFGPEVTRWQRVVTVRDYLSRGVFQSTLPHYAIAAIALYGLSWLGYLNWGRYWRWVILIALGVFECHLVTRPRLPVPLALTNAFLATFGRAPYLPFQVILLLRKACITLYIAFNQLGPVFDSYLQPEKGGSPEEDDEAELDRNLGQLNQLAAELNKDADKLLNLELVPFAGDPQATESMRAKVKDWLVQNTIRGDPMVKDAVGTSLNRRRANAPPGARGTK